MKKSSKYLSTGSKNLPLVASAKGRKGFKTANDPLRQLLEMANLDVKGELPFRGEEKFSWKTVSDLVAALILIKPDSVRLHLLEVMNDPTQWRWSPEYFTNAGFKPEVAEAAARAQAVTDRYRLIYGARRTLEIVVSGERIIPANVTIERRPPDHKGREIAQYTGDELAHPLIGVDLRYIKQCEICERFFYAPRITSDACTPQTCGKTLQKRREREAAKQKAKRAKQKRATAARKR
jgi:hypothetical protein